MTSTDIFKQKALSGYLVCFMNNCPLREQCLHWQVGQHMPQNPPTCISVNPHGEHVATENCKLFRTTQKQRMAKGMEGIFNDDMPKRLEPAIRNELIMRYNRTYFFEYRNGTRLMSPAMQEEIRDLFRHHGWTQEVHFDAYVEDYAW